MDFATIATISNPSEAELIRSRLEANGFMVMLKNEETAFTFGAGSLIGGVQIQVPEDQAVSAKELLASQDSSEQSI